MRLWSCVVTFLFVGRGQNWTQFSFSFSVFQLPIVHSVCAKFCTICCFEMLVGICRPPHFTTIAYAKFGGTLVNYGQMENRGWPCSGVCYIVHVIVCLQCHGPNHYQLLYTKWIREILYLVLLSWAQLWTKWKNWGNKYTVSLLHLGLVTFFMTPYVTYVIFSQFSRPSVLMTLSYKNVLERWMVVVEWIRMEKTIGLVKCIRIERKILPDKWIRMERKIVLD